MDLETPSWEAALGGSLDSKHKLIGEFETSEKPSLKNESKQTSRAGEMAQHFRALLFLQGTWDPSSRTPAGPGLLPHQPHQDQGSFCTSRTTLSSGAPSKPGFTLQQHHKDQGSFCSSTIRTRVLSAPAGPGLRPQPSGLGFILQQHPSGPRFFFFSSTSSSQSPAILTCVGSCLDMAHVNL